MSPKEAVKRIKNIFGCDYRYFLDNDDAAAIDMAIIALNFWEDVKENRFIIYRQVRCSGKSYLKEVGFTEEEIEKAFNDAVKFNNFLADIIKEAQKNDN